MLSTAVSADSRIKVVELLEHLQCGHVFESRFHADTTDQLPDQSHLLPLGSVAEQSVMPDSDESVRKNMHEESPYELFGGEA